MAPLAQEQMAAYLHSEKVMLSKGIAAALDISECLGRPSNDIRMDDDFLHLGAESITACGTKAEVLFSVAHLFIEPRLRV